MALKGSPNKNRKKDKKQPITIADIQAIRQMDHEQLYNRLEQTLGSTKNVVDEKPDVSYTCSELNTNFSLQLAGLVSILLVITLII